MNGGTKVLLTIAAAVVALFVLFPLLKTVLGLVYTVVNVAVGLFWFAAILAIAIFVIGICRRLMRG